MYLIPLLSEPDNLEEDFTGSGTLAAVIGLYLIIILAYFASLAGVIFGGVGALEAAPESVGGCVSAGFRALLSTILVMLVLVVITVFCFGAASGASVYLIPRESLRGMLAYAPAMGGGVFVIVFVWLMVIFYPVIPAIVIERLRPIAAIRRAARLTRKNRWRILGLFLAWGASSCR